MGVGQGARARLWFVAGLFATSSGAFITVAGLADFRRLPRTVLSGYGLGFVATTSARTIGSRW